MGDLINLFGFECGDGWFELLRDCIEGIKEVCERNGFDVYALQVKEKYGILRFYLSTTASELDDIIEAAEYRSSKTCETCGKEGYLAKQSGYWWHVTCDDCEKLAKESSTS